MRRCQTCNKITDDDRVLCPDDQTPLVEDPLATSLQQALGAKYTLTKLIGKGAMGAVYRARHRDLDDVAIKVMLGPTDNAQLSERFLREARALRRLRHQHAVTVYDLDRSVPGITYMVMEMVEGGSLRQDLRARGHLTLEATMEVAEAVCGALQAAHDRGIIHRDLKPDNILVAEEVTVSGRILRTIKIADFGIVKLRGGLRDGDTAMKLTQVGTPIGTPFYMSPEQWFGEGGGANALDGRTDIYALGCTLYELLSGRTPFTGKTSSELRRQHLEHDPSPLSEIAPHVPEPVSRAIMRALEKDRDDRPQSAAEFYGELRRAYNESRRAEVINTPEDHLPPTELKHVDEVLPVAPRPHDTKESLLSADTARAEEARRAQEARQAEAARQQAPRAEPEHREQKERPIYLDENVQFTVYRPRKVKPQKWYKLLAYAHLSERPPDADEDEPDPIAQMEEEAERILGEKELRSYRKSTEDSLQAVPRRGEITFVPFVEGVEFNPPSSSFLWQESVHRQEFRMRASAALDSKVARGRMSIFLGAILLAEINLSIQVDNAYAFDDQKIPAEREKPARPYRKIFPSYSHQDREIVAQIEYYAQVTGDKYMRDLYELRSGQDWKRWMRETIEQADIFQLFWSTNSMRSENVRLEWEYALRLQRPNFIRPTYWEDPLPQSPAENLPPPELRDMHFQHVRPLSSTHLAPAGGWPVGGGAPEAEKPHFNREVIEHMPEQDAEITRVRQSPMQTQPDFTDSELTVVPGSLRGDTASWPSQASAEQYVAAMPPRRGTRLRWIALCVVLLVGVVGVAGTGLYLYRQHTESQKEDPRLASSTQPKTLSTIANSPTGTLRINAPAGSEVFVDDEKAGVTGENRDFTVQAPVGVRNVRITASGYRPWIKDAGVTANLTTSLKPELKGALVAAKQSTDEERQKRAEEFLRVKNYYAAEVEYRELLKANPNDATLRLKLAEALNEQKRYAEAIPEYEQAARLDQKNTDTLLLLASLYAIKGRDADAEATLRRAVKLAPQDADAHNALAWVLQRSPDKLDEAMDEIDRALKISRAPDFLDTKAYILLARKSLDEALKTEQRALSLDKNHDPMFRAGVAVILYNMGRTDEAIASYKEIRQANPTAEWSDIKRLEMLRGYSRPVLETFAALIARTN